MGCGHLKLVLENSEHYGSRYALSKEAIQSFFKLLWQGNMRMNYVMLQGKHNETCVVTIDSEKEIDKNTSIPYSCSEHNGSKFVNHKVARNFFLNKGSKLIASTLLGQGHLVNENEVLNMAIEIADCQLTKTLNSLAGDLPRYRMLI